MTEKPFDLVHNNLDKVAYVYLKDGRLITGTMIGYDKELNISLSDAYYDRGDEKKKFDKVVIRRNNILSIANEEGLIWEE